MMPTNLQDNDFPILTVTISTNIDPFKYDLQIIYIAFCNVRNVNK